MEKGLPTLVPGILYPKAAQQNLEETLDWESEQFFKHHFTFLSGVPDSLYSLEQEGNKICEPRKFMLLSFRASYPFEPFEHLAHKPWTSF